MATASDWKRLLDHVMAVPERIYEHWSSSVGWDNHTQFGQEYGWDGVAWCAIFDWDMYHDVGLDAIVPKTASVAAMAAWAKQHSQWSEYPSVGAWVDFGNGSHTEIVVGFDADNVYTKGGNSIQAGASDGGQGNGVWSHSHARTSSYVTGYFAPHFPDGCPPTADPNDYRGGTAVTSYTWPGPDSPTPTPVAEIARYQVVINGLAYGYGAHGDHVAKVGEALVAKGFGQHYAQGPGPTWSDADTLNYSDYQQSLGYTGMAPHEDADGVPGPTTLKQLLGYIPAASAPAPTVSLAHVRAAAQTDPGAPQGHQTHPADVRIVEAALMTEGLLDSAFARDGSWGTKTITAYAHWQRRAGVPGPYDGIPGTTSLTKLGKRHGFTVTA
ncbi:peptidoglycan-binding protein [Streptomyces sp. NPDC020801]|uniref:peptidoglycan-binding protein n=1 Tax=Streptomyces sp. NPDC020801 TaxID=3365093 RepID=UPI0037B003CB